MFFLRNYNLQDACMKDKPFSPWRQCSHIAYPMCRVKEINLKIRCAQLILKWILNTYYTRSAIEHAEFARVAWQPSTHWSHISRSKQLNLTDGGRSAIVGKDNTDGKIIRLRKPVGYCVSGGDCTAGWCVRMRNTDRLSSGRVELPRRIDDTHWNNNYLKKLIDLKPTGA